MEDLERLLALMKYCGDQTEAEGLATLNDVVMNKVPFDSDRHDIEGAFDVAYHTLYTLFDLEYDDGVIFGRPKLSMEALMGDLILLLERMANYLQGQTDEWPNA